MWVMIDNYDSFTYMLYHYLLQLHPDILIYRNDALTIAELEALQPERIIISPGPQHPAAAGITMEVIARFYNKLPILGVCLGHQALGQFFGGSVTKAAQPVHGSTSTIYHQQEHIFRNIPSGFQAMRYHSLIVQDWETTGIQPLAFTATGALMAFSHPLFPVTGIQFHPESVLTGYGMQLLRNWHELHLA